MTQTNLKPFKLRWLSAVRAAPGLSAGDLRVAEWLASHLDNGTTALCSWQLLQNDLSVSNHAAGVHLTMLSKAGLVGGRIRTGPGAGWRLELPLSGSKKSRTDAEKNARRLAARKAADLRADAKWLAK